MQRILPLLIALLATATVAAQYETVVLNYEKSYFGENRPLPAQQYFILTGPLQGDYPYVEVHVYEDSGSEDRDPLYSTSWKVTPGTTPVSFNVPVNYRLRQNDEYDVLIQFYRPLNDGERDDLRKYLYRVMDAYVDQAVAPSSSRRLRLTSSKKKTVREMNEIIADNMRRYRSRTRDGFAPFKDIIRLKLEEIDGMRTDKEGVKREQALKNFRSALYNEIDAMLTGELFVLADDKYIEDYQTEKLNNAFYIAPHFGYGAIALNDDFDDLNYANDMYVGISFPLSRNENRRFWYNSSLSLGAFLGDLEDEGGREISGPFVGVPTYAAYGYRLVSFLRLQAGAVFLESDDAVPGFDSDFEVRPFVGLSAELNVWFNLGGERRR